jgi:D-glycero-D-manno-heptose 1,7-bisphosphate phosphatase
MSQQQFVLLDRDGTIIVERHYLSEPDQVELIPGVTEGLRLLSERGFGLVVITNQSAIGRGYFDQARLELIHRRLLDLLESEGIRMNGIYYCPHTPTDHCDCRKPQPGMIEKAAAEFGFNPEDAFVIGDKACDIELGQRVGAKTFLVRTGYGSQVVTDMSVNPDFVVNDVREAALRIEQVAILEKERFSNVRMQ